MIPCSSWKKYVKPSKKCASSQQKFLLHVIMGELRSLGASWGLSWVDFRLSFSYQSKFEVRFMLKVDWKRLNLPQNWATIGLLWPFSLRLLEHQVFVGSAQVSIKTLDSLHTPSKGNQRKLSTFSCTYNYSHLISYLNIKAETSLIIIIDLFHFSNILAKFQSSPDRL